MDQFDALPTIAPVGGARPTRWAPQPPSTSERLRLLLRQNELIVEELALPSLHGQITEAVRHLVPARSAALAVLGADRTVRQLVQQDAGEDAATSVLVPETGLARLSDLVRGLPLGAVSRRPGVDEPATGTWSRPFAAVPVHYRRDLLGALLLAEPAGGLSGEDEDVLLSLAVTAGTAIENARLYDEARRRQEWMRASAEVGNALLALTSQREALALVSETLRKLADAELVAVWVPNPARDALVGVLVEGDDADPLLGLTIEGTEPVVAEILRTGRGLRLCAADRPDCPWLAAVDQAGVGPVLALPLSRGGGAAGLLLAGRRRDRPPFSDVDLDLAETYADQMALALDRLSARATEQRLGLLEDRERIARDLHDHVIQSLFATGLKVQGAERLSQEPALSHRLAEVVGDIDATIRRLRTTIFQLADAAPAGSGLRGAVLEVVAELGPVLSFEPAVEFEGPVDTATDAGLVEEVVAVLREAATNAGKHARASRLLIRLQVDGTHLALTVQDDGVGIGPATRRSGLANLRRRAERLGGTLEVSEPTGGGTRLCWRAPLAG